MDDRTLARQAQEGDLKAFSKLVNHYQELAFRAAYLILRDAAEAEDAVQEGFVKAFNGLANFRPGMPFRPWLLRIVTNEARNRMRSSVRRARLPLEIAGFQSATDGAPSPETTALVREQRQMLLAELDQMLEMDRVVLTYHYFLDLSIAEIADALECPQSTVRTRLFRARKRLKEQLLASMASEDAAANSDKWKDACDG